MAGIPPYSPPGPSFLGRWDSGSGSTAFVGFRRSSLDSLSFCLSEIVGIGASTISFMRNPPCLFCLSLCHDIFQNVN